MRGVWNSQVLLLELAVFANHAYYGIVHRVHDLLNFPAIRLPIIREVAVLMAHYSQVSTVRIDRDLSGRAAGRKDGDVVVGEINEVAWGETPEGERPCRHNSVTAKGKPRTPSRCTCLPACLPACLPGLAWSANRSIPRSDYRGAADTEFYMRLLFRSLSPRPIGFSIFAPCYRGETIIYPHLPALSLLPHLFLSLSRRRFNHGYAKVNCARNALSACCKGTAFLRYIGKTRVRQRKR